MFKIDMKKALAKARKAYVEGILGMQNAMITCRYNYDDVSEKKGVRCIIGAMLDKKTIDAIMKEGVNRQGVYTLKNKKLIELDSEEYIGELQQLQGRHDGVCNLSIPESEFKEVFNALLRKYELAEVV